MVKAKRMVISVVFMIFLLTTLPVAFAVSVNPDSIAVDVSDTGATISWEADTASTGLINYGLTIDDLLQEESPGEDTLHEVTIADLEPGTDYTYNIEAQDDAGTYISSFMGFTTLPGAPEDLEATQEDNAVILTWTPVIGAELYYIYKDGVYSDIAYENSYTAYGLEYDSSYTFAVEAVDDQGRQGAQASVEITLEAEPIEFSFVQARDVTRNSATVSWETDTPKNARIDYGVDQEALDQTQTDSDELEEHIFYLRDLIEETTYYYKITSGGVQDEQTYTFTTLGNETPLDIFNINVSDITRSSAEISWTTNLETKGTIKYSIDDSFSQSKREDTDEIHHSEQLEGLLSGATYYFKIEADEQESDIYSFTTSEDLYDFIDMEEVPTLWHEEALLLKGSTAQDGKVYIFVNKETNPYAQVMMDIEGTYFEAEIQLNPYAYVDDVVGRNIIEIHSWDAQNNKAVKTYTVDVDTGVPILTVGVIPTHTNQDELPVSGWTEPGAVVNFVIDGKSKGSMYVANESGYFSYNVPVGTATTNHTLGIEAADAAGNIATYEKQIFVDRQDPKLTFFTSFAGQTHYKLFRIDGQAEPNATIIVTNYGEYSGCEDINFQTKYGGCDYLANTYGPGPRQTFEVLLDPTNLMADLLELAVGAPTTAVANEEGNFSVIVPLFAGGVEKQLVSTNTIVFNVTDLAGNNNVYEKQVRYQPSCIDWVQGKTTSFPLNIYTQDMTAGDVVGSLIFELSYIGGGVPDVSKITVKEDESGGKLIKEGKAELGTAETLYYAQTYGGLENSNEYVSISAQEVKSTAYDRDSQKVYVYVPVSINHYKGSIEELPEQLGVYLDTYISYTDNQGQVASCHIYPTASYDIQKPESLSKWFSPTMINKTITVLDDTINVTESAVKYAGIASRWTTVACGATIAYGYLKGFAGGGNFIEGSDGQQCNADLKTIYAVCDRILCPAIPPNCEGFQKSSGYTVNGKKYGTDVGGLQDGERAYNLQKEKNDEARTGLTAQYNEYKADIDRDASFTDFYDNLKRTDPTLAHSYDYDSSLEKPDKYTTNFEGREISVKYYDVDEVLPGTGQTAGQAYRSYECEDADDVQSLIVFTGLEENEAPGFSIAGAKATQSSSVWCSSEHKEDLDEPNSRDIPGCWSDQCPQFDNTKCLFGKGYNINPADDLFASLQCGCLPGVKGHLENLLKILKAAKKCFQQALIGETTAGYCERLMSYFICDILTQIFKHLFTSLGQGTGFLAGLMGERTVDNFKETSQSISTGLSSRYGDIVDNRLGLSTDDIVNKACLAAFTADWSLLEDALDSVVDQVNVAPIASAQANSRPYGFDPFTGKVNIAYNAYVGIVPGGETYIEAWLECDRGKEGGEYCAEGADKIDLVAKGRVPGYMTRDDFFDENILYIDNNGASWYNQLVLQLKYEIGGEWQTETITKPITKKGDLSALNCRFSVTYGFECSVGEFMDLAGGTGGAVQLYSTSQGTTLSPSVSTYYGQNQVSALVKIKNSYPDDFYIRVDNGAGEFEYWALGGSETGQFRGLQYYLLWLGGSGGPSGSATVLRDWTQEVKPTGQKEIGFMLPQEFDQATLKLYPFDINTRDLGQIKCELAKTPSGFSNPVGVRIEGEFYPVNNDANWVNVCSRDSSFEGCGNTWDTTLEEKYSRVVSTSDGDAYKCITKYDKLKDSKEYDDVHFLKFVKFSGEVLSGSSSGPFRFNMYDAATSAGDTFIETAYESVAGTSSSTARINVLDDMNDNNAGETKIFSNDENPKDQETKLTYTFSSSTTDNLKPVIHFIEPTSIIEEPTGYVNSDHNDVPIGFTLWDDKNEINTISIGIVGNQIAGSQYQCKVTWEYDEATNKLTDVSWTKEIDGYPCGFKKETSRHIGFEQGMPPFFEFDLIVDGEDVIIDNDAYYDISIEAEDADQNEAEPRIRRIRFSDSIKDKYEDMLVCLGGSQCSSSFGEANEDVEEIAVGSVHDSKKEDRVDPARTPSDEPPLEAP